MTEAAASATQAVADYAPRDDGEWHISTAGSARPRSSGERPGLPCVFVEVQRERRPVRSTKAGAESLYQVAGRWINECLNADGSLLTPGRGIWTQEGLAQLSVHFVDNPDLGKG